MNRVGVMSHRRLWSFTHSGSRGRCARRRSHLEILEGRILLSAGPESEGERPVTFPPPLITTGPVSIWQGATFAQADAGDTGPAEVGITFHADEDGLISGLRFYKNAANTGTHVGSLWTADGKLLASATFTAETASGWQQVAFKKPVAIAADTTYVVGYSTTAGHYTAVAGYFADYGVYTGPLHSDAGVIATSPGAFPT